MQLNFKSGSSYDSYLLFMAANIGDDIDMIIV